VETTRLPRYGDELVVRIERLDEKGNGRGTTGEGDLVCGVRLRGGLPGSVVRVQALARRRRIVEAKLLEVLEAAPGAVAPRCPHFGPCGGCAAQHLAYPAQLEIKRARVAEALRELVASERVEAVLGMDDPWHYRNKLDFTFGARRWRTEDEATGLPADFALGLHVPGMWSKVLDVHTCSIAFEGADALLREVRRLALARGLTPWDTRAHTGLLRHLVLRRGVRTGQTMLVLVTSERAAEAIDPLVSELLAAFPWLTTVVQDISTSLAAVAVGQEQHVLHGPGTIDEVLLGRTFTISPHSFFQTNTLQAERLFEVVRDEAALPAGGAVLDLYCGAGTIGLCLADADTELLGFESVEAAVRDARANASANGIHRARFEAGDVLDSLARLDPAPWRSREGVLVLDPPRAGLHADVVPAVLAFAAPRIVYVSCNPDSAARDLAALLAPGEYTIERVRPVDLFPHTPHIETVISLRRVSPHRPPDGGSV